MIDSGQGTIRSPYDPLCVPQPFESLWRGDFVYEVTINVDQRLSLFRVDEVVVIDLVVERAWGRRRGGHRGSVDMDVSVSVSMN